MLNIYSPAKYGPKDIIIPDFLSCQADAVRNRGSSKTAISNLYSGGITHLQKAKSNLKQKNNDLFQFLFHFSHHCYREHTFSLLIDIFTLSNEINFFFKKATEQSVSLLFFFSCTILIFSG